MNLYLISQEANGGYDTYDSAVVAAEDEARARLTHPDGCWELGPYQRHVWADDPRDVAVRYLGKADAAVKPGIICASFNAG